MDNADKLIRYFEIMRIFRLIQDHPNIIKMYQLFEDYNNYYIVS